MKRLIEKMFKLKRTKGFTLIELIVTIAILGVLVLLAAPRFSGHVQNAELTKGFADAKSIQKASEQYFMDNEDWPRLTDDPYTSEEIKAYSEHIYDTKGKEVNLDPNGNYYNIDYNKLKEYIKVPSNKEDYILQNPVGKIFYMDELTESGSNRVDYTSNKQANLRTPSKPTVTEETESSYTVTGEDGTEVKLNDGEWKTSPNLFEDLNDGETYSAYSRFKETENYSASKVSEVTEFEVEVALPWSATFTNANSTGRTGPSQSQLDSAYAGTILEKNVTSDKGIQLWTVPESGTYRIETYGAQGGTQRNGVGGFGAKIKADFYLTRETQLKILIGQQPVSTNKYNNHSSGGGGGTFVATLANTPVIVAGGGGGGHSGINGMNANVNKDGTRSSNNTGTPGTNGTGGSDGYGGGGGGFFGDGSKGTWGKEYFGGISFVNGGSGGPWNAGYENTDVGGFGGGGSTHGNCLGGGGGGGYSGGANNISGCNGGGGGGSYNSGANQENSVGNTGHGKVIITLIGK